jgi:hypothetical protein
LQLKDCDFSLHSVLLEIDACGHCLHMTNPKVIGPEITHFLPPAPMPFLQNGKSIPSSNPVSRKALDIVTGVAVSWHCICLSLGDDEILAL